MHSGHPGPDPPQVSRRVILALRLLLLVAAAAALGAGVFIGSQHADATHTRYTCPMHPEVDANGPGQCPICFMALEPAATRGVRTPAEIMDMADFTAVENVRKHRITEFVRPRSLLRNVQELRGPASVRDDLTLDVVLYRDQVEVLAADEQGIFCPTLPPRLAVTVRRADAEVVPWDASTARVRFRVDDKDKAVLRPGQVGWLELDRRAREVLAVPATALLQSPEGPYVLVPAGSRFEKRSVAIGETLLKQGFAVVLSGLRAQERVVSRAAFFVDADRRLALRETESDWADP
jgi:hypothetical protein